MADKRKTVSVDKGTYQLLDELRKAEYRSFNNQLKYMIEREHRKVFGEPDQNSSRGIASLLPKVDR